LNSPVPAATHSLLMPVDLEWPSLERGGPSGTGAFWDPESTFQWDHLRPLPRRPKETLACVFDLAEMGRLLPTIPGQAEARWRDMPGFTKSLHKFISKWGMLDPGNQLRFDTQHSRPLLLVEKNDHHFMPGWERVDRWKRVAQEVYALLVTLARTLEGELVDESILWMLQRYDFNAEQQWKLALWRSERRGGRGVDLQKALILRALEWYSLPPRRLHPIWDAKGRRMEEGAEGVRQIVAAHMDNIFSADLQGIFICSECGNLFPVDEFQRRPRRDRGRFCSDSCRAEAARKTKLASWHRHKWGRTIKERGN
jgi:hypothetical protein